MGWNGTDHPKVTCMELPRYDRNEEDHPQQKWAFASKRETLATYPMVMTNITGILL